MLATAAIMNMNARKITQSRDEWISGEENMKHCLLQFTFSVLQLLALCPFFSESRGLFKMVI